MACQLPSAAWGDFKPLLLKSVMEDSSITDFITNNYIPRILSLIQLWPDRFYFQWEERNSQVRQSPKWRWIHHPKVQSWPKWWLQSWHRCISSNFCNVEKPFCFFEISIPLKRQKIVHQDLFKSMEKKLNVVIWRKNLCTSKNASFHQPKFLEGSQLIFSQQKKVVEWKEVKKQISYYKDLTSCAGLYALAL